jgi:hypothetical protein
MPKPLQKFVLLVYTDTEMMNALPAGGFDGMMRDCFEHADALRDRGRLLDSQQLEGPETARAVRVRDGRVTAMDGPFAETKELLGGFNLIEAEDIDEAVRIAARIPWAQTGCIEVRPVRDMGAVRRAVGAPEAAAQVV